MIQWGKINSVTGNKSVTVQYAVSYTSKCRIFKNMGSTSTAHPQDRSVCFNDISISNAVTMQAANYNSSWMSIGY